MNETDSGGDLKACLDEERIWYYFVSASLATMIGLTCVVLFFRLVSLPCRRKRWGDDGRDAALLIEPSIGTVVHNWAGDLISGNTTTGRLLVVFAFSCSIFALGLYIYDVDTYDEMERSISWTKSSTVQIDFGLSIFFVVYFFIRFVAAEHKLFFIFTIESIVDYFTVIPCFLSVYYGRSWHGLRFLRALILLNLSDVLVYLRLINTSSSIRLVKVSSIFISVILTSAGICHLLENSGDPWSGDCGFENRHSPHLSFGSCIYFMFVTMSTVGYGDIFCTTDLGRVFIVMYMLGGLTMFANYVPEIIRLIGNRPRYAGEYTPDGRQFIIVCGNVNYETVTTFLYDFFHPARDDVDVEVVFLNKGEPDLEFEGLLKREHTRVQYFRGSMLNAFDLQRVRADQAAACLVLANKFCEEPDAEDAANIMRVISLKNYCEDTRVIIQLMQYHNKGYLLNIPGWDWKRDDQAVCLNELKLGFIAQSCLAPGFSTLVSNLVIIGSPECHKEVPRWKQEYLVSSNKVILAETLSPTFVGMTFIKAAEICYSELNLLLLAIEARKFEGGDIYINPRNKIINPNAIGLFITDCADSAKRAWFYCRKCHANIRSEKQVTKCSCKRTAVRLLDDDSRCNNRRIMKNKRQLKKQMTIDYIKENGNSDQELIDLENQGSKVHPSVDKMEIRRRKKTSGKINMEKTEQSKMKYDSTGMFHWCPARDLSDSLMDRQEAAMTVLQNHVIVAVFANPDSPLIGLRNLVMPLRASNINYNDLIQVVIVGNAEYLQREWKLLQNLPKVSVLDGSPLSRADLRAVKIDLCRMCVILSAKVPSRVEPVLADKEVILTNLNIKSMMFTDDEDEDLAALEGKIISAKGSRKKVNSVLGELLVNHPSEGNFTKVPTIVDLAFASNVRFLDDEELHLDNVELHKTLPFAAGHALARGILDSLMSTTYFNASALRLIRQWVTGGATIELELALAEGAGLRGGYSTAETLAKRDRFRVDQVFIRDSVYMPMVEQGCNFGQIFVEAASKYNTLCIGVYRIRGPQYEGDNSEIRILISSPDKKTRILKSDIVITLQQFDEDKEKTE